MTVNCGAALVLAYKRPLGLGALAEYFGAAEIDLLVHVDAKATEAPFRAAVRDARVPVHFIENRTEVFWRGFTMIEATVSLLRKALERPYAWFALISDDSLPLVAPSELRNRLERGDEYLSSQPTDASHPFLLRYRGFYMFDSQATTARWGPVSGREVTPEAVQRISRLGALQQRGKKPLAALYHGGQWWALQRRSAEIFLESWDQDEWMRESFEFSEVPDELYIQTVLALADPGRTSRKFMHTEWDVPSPPRVYTSADELRARQSSGALFIRKADLPALELISYIDELVNLRSPGS